MISKVCYISFDMILDIDESTIFLILYFKIGFVSKYFHFEEECKRLEEKDQDFNRITKKYDILLKEKEHLDGKLNGQCC